MCFFPPKISPANRAGNFWYPKQESELFLHLFRQLFSCSHNSNSVVHSKASICLKFSLRNAQHDTRIILCNIAATKAIWKKSAFHSILFESESNLFFSFTLSRTQYCNYVKSEVIFWKICDEFERTINRRSLRTILALKSQFIPSNARE